MFMSSSHISDGSKNHNPNPKSDFQIFDLSRDIGESDDLSSSHPEKLAELKQRLETHYKELVDGSHVWGN